MMNLADPTCKWQSMRDDGSTGMQPEFRKPAHVARYAEKIVTHNKHHLPASTALLQMTGAAMSYEQRTIVCKITQFYSVARFS